MAKKENYCKRSKLTKHPNGLEFLPLEGDTRCPPRCDLCLGIGSIASVAASLTQSPAKQSVLSPEVILILEFRKPGKFANGKYPD